MKYRHRVLAFLASLSILTYLDRVCISVAGPRIQNEFHLSPGDWGLVTGAFAISYLLFEIPGGYLADRFGARAMMARIVIWWSAFTSLTGIVSGLQSMVVVRFLFGAGEAGAYPTAATVVFRWFPEVERGRSFGWVLCSGQVGAAIAPLLIVPIQLHFGWRASFYVFGVVGLIWAGAWWRWYRNRPAEKIGITAAELAEIGPPAVPDKTFPHRAIVSNSSIWALMGATFAYLYSYYFFLFWLPTYLMRERGFTEVQTILSAIPFVIGTLCNLGGGFARDAAVKRWGTKDGTRVIGVLALGLAGLSVLGALVSSTGYEALACLAVCYGGITFQQPSVFVTCIAVGRRSAGAVAGCINSAGALGGLCSSFVFGYLIQRTGNYDAVLVSMAGALLAGSCLWLVVDATQLLHGADAG